MTDAVSSKTAALGKFRVLDFTQVRSGPACVRQLADFGADVIRIEAPDALGRAEMYVGRRDGADMQNLHRNKRSITLDLKSVRAKELLRRLVKTADVVVENFRPDVKARLGLDYDTLQAINPRIVLASISGFGQTGPYRDRPGFDPILQGMSGLMSVTGFAEGDPVRSGASLTDLTAGLYAALGILTALLERETSGKGQWVQSSLLHAGIALMDFQAVRYSVEGEVPPRVGNDHPTSMPTSVYATSNGYINIAVGGEKHWRAFCALIGQPELIDDPRYITDVLRSQNRPDLNALLADVFAARSADEWSALLSKADIPCGPVYTMDQVAHDAQVEHAGIFQPVDHPRRGPISLIAQGATLSRTPAHIAATLQDKGGSTHAVLAELGFSGAEIADLERDHTI